MKTKVMILIFLAFCQVNLLKLNSKELSNAELNMMFEDVLSNFSNYRFGAVSIYEMPNSELSLYFESKESENKKDEGNNSEIKTLIDNLDVKLKDKIINLISGINDIDDAEEVTALKKTIKKDYNISYDDNTIKEIYKYLTKSNIKMVTKAYIITTKNNMVSDNYNDRKIIGMVVYRDVENPKKKINNIHKALSNNISKERVFTIFELTNEKLNLKEYSNIETLLDLINLKFMQGDMKNVTLDAKDIGNVVKWASKDYGNTAPLVNYDTRYDISEKVLQQYKKISEGNPTSIGDLTNEITISPDLIRWQYYNPVYITTIDEDTGQLNFEQDEITGGNKVDATMSSNDNLPNFGMELKYGVEGLYYNSFWSERLSLNAIWKSMKLGVILPTNGWSSLSSDLYNQDRRFTNSSSIGLGGKIDFPFYLIKMSDVWEFNFGYVFGDANQSTLHNRPELNDFKNDIIGFQNRQKDYLLRGNAQLHYSFAMNIDEDYLLRFGLGGTFYSVESWVNTVQIDSTNRTPKESLGYVKNETESVGGVSGRMDFMSKGNATPYGFSMMYFDETLGLNAWLQIPVIENIFALRLEANGYAVAFKSKERDWENSSIFTPMLRVVYNF